MQTKFSEFGNFIKSKNLFPLTKDLLNILFVLSISSFIFEKFYFKYDLIDVTDYKIVYAFFVKGDFAIPLSIFFISWALTNILGNLTFLLANSALTNYFRRQIERTEIELKKEFDKVEKNVKEVHNISMKERYGKDWINYLIEKIKLSFSQAEYEKLLRYMSKTKIEKEDEFVILLRGLIAISIYVCVVPYFGKILYFLLISTFLFYVLIIVSIYQLMELTPELISKIKQAYNKMNKT